MNKIGIGISIFLICFEAWSAAKAGRGWRLSDLLRDPKLNGLVFDSVEDQRLVQTRLQEFFDFQDEKFSDEKMEQIVDSCSSANSNPFCRFVLESSLPKSKKKLSKKARKREIVRLVKKSLQAGKYQLPADATESDLHEVFKGFHKISQVNDLGEKLLKDKDCPSSALLVAVAMKLETQFPLEKFKLLASRLYERTLSCSLDVSSLHAGYRLGLISVWEGRCDRAEEVLSKIPDSVQTQDYRLRISYWRWHCANQLKNDFLKNELSANLIKNYPLSLHTILVQPNPNFSEASLLNRDPQISFRTLTDSKLNEVTRAVEGLLSQGQINYALELLRAHSELAFKTEIPFRLYWSILFSRVGDQPDSFQMMASVFRENPVLISRDTLQLMYPLHQFDTIQKTGIELDPFLIISLIRQESAFNEIAKSPAGAIGLMQLRPSTARNFERVSTKQLFNPQVNIRVGIKYLSQLLKRYNGETELALAAYNAGPQRIAEWTKRYPIENRMLFLDLLPISETREYVSSIVRNYFWYSKLYQSTLQGPPVTQQRPQETPNPAPVFQLLGFVKSS